MEHAAPPVPERYPVTARTSPTRAVERVGYDRAAVHAVLDEALVCHVGFVVDGAPVVLPHLHARVGEVLYLHGSTGARAMLAARAGDLPVCVTVTLLDGLVLARSAFHHSVNYRSAVVHGEARLVEDRAEQTVALAALVAAVAPGRTDGCRPPSARELAATAVLAVPLVEVSLKARSGPPVDDPADLTDPPGPYWAGVLPLGLRPGTPVPAPDATTVPVPAHVSGWTRTGAGAFSRR